MNAAVATPRVSFEDYLELEETSDVRHEWCDGAVFAMSRGTPEHGRLTLAIGGELRSALRRECRGYAAEAMLFIEQANRATYADAFFVWGEPIEKTALKNGRSLGVGVTNPTIIVEVLSESTERYARLEKFELYRQLPSFEEYVLVSQDARRIEVYRRGNDGAWLAAEHAGAGGTVTVHGATLAVDDVYAP